MIEGLRPYPDVIATGIEWLPAVPAHWETRRVKTVLQEVDRRTSTGEEKLLSLRMIAGLVGHHETGGRPIPPEALVSFKKIEAGQIVMNRMRAASGLFGVAEEPGLVSPDYAVFRELVDANRQYLLRLFKTAAMGAIFRSESKGLGTGQSGFLRLYTDRFGAIRIPLPPLDEQRLIVRFLDWHGAMTGKLIRAKRRLITLLNEQKQSIIHRAVTRGLDPAAKLKPSGVEWLGNVPEHWEVRKVREVARVVNGYPFDAELFTHGAGFPLIRIRDLNKSETAVRYSGDFIEAAAIAPSETLIGMDGDFNVGTWKGTEAALLNQRMCCVRSNDPALNPFIRLALVRPLKEINAITWSTTVKHLSSGQVERIKLALPPAEEAERILRHLGQELEGVEAIESAIRRELQLVQEFRTRLIADVVTGQLDVRAVAANLPELTEDVAEADMIDEDDLDADADELIDAEEAA